MNRSTIVIAAGLSVLVASPVWSDQTFSSNKTDFRIETVAQALSTPGAWLSCPTAPCWSPNVRVGFAGLKTAILCESR